MSTKSCITVLFSVCLICGTAAAQSLGQPDTTYTVHYDAAPQFKGGLANWQKFLQNNLDVSRIAMAMDSVAYVDYGLRQRADLEFTVCENGEVCDVAVSNKKDVSPEFAKEVLRLMKRSPKWIPATVEGQPVRVKFSQSIVIQLP